MTQEAVIKVKNLSKRYRIGLADERKETFAQQIAHILFSPIRNFRKLKSLSKFGANDDESIFWALKDINFEVKKGEVLGIIGHNGAGKSTLLKILSRITEPTIGEIEIHGRVSSLLEVGTGFHQDLTGRENVYLNATILGMTKKEVDSKFDQILEFSGIGKYIDTPVKRYSSGMKVRLAFSVAAHLEPDILIIDEVLAVGDADFQKRCLGKMEDISGQGRTVLFVSHNLNAVKTICNNSILLEKGKLIFEDTTEKVIDKYLNLGGMGNPFYVFGDEGIIEDKNLVLKEIYILCDGKKLIGTADIDKGISINIEFEICQTFEEYYSFTLQFKNTKGDILFISGSGNEQNKIKGLHPDKKILKCEIDAPFFNEGDFSINMLVVKSSKKVVKKFEDVLRFNVGPKETKIGQWMGKSKGWLRPALEWELETL